MEHAAVVAGLVRGKPGFLFEQQQSGLGPRFQKTISCCESDDAAADNDGVVIHLAFLPPLRKPTIMVLVSVASIPNNRKNLRQKFISGHAASVSRAS